MRTLSAQHWYAGDELLFCAAKFFGALRRAGVYGCKGNLVKTTGSENVIGKWILSSHREVP